MAEDLLEGQAVEETAPDGGPDADVRPLPEPRRRGEVDALRGEVTTAALAAAGGVVAGAATVAVVRAIGGARRVRGRRLGMRRGGRPANVVASRSFLVDVHVLGNR